MKSTEIRQQFLDYFRKNNHTIVDSSSLVPADDPTLLFTNAGMVQFKDVFLGNDKRSYNKAVTIQRCLRVSGKHNDLENVGFTARHHTFFEMLGNFSFGDYFKRQAIKYAWEFLTEILKIPVEKLWVTVHQDDKEAENIWLNEMKIDAKRFSRCGDKDNFWAMGETGPCGYCSEIFYDHGAEFAGGPPGSENADADRFIEIWNLVFMQFERDQDGKTTPLPNPSIDTGMGLERIAAVMQGVHNNYDTDIFKYLIKAIIKIIDTKQPPTNPSLRVIADHIRAIAFLIADGVLPANVGRGYVLRRIIRRALRHAHKLGVTKPLLYKVVKPLIDIMGDAYPILISAQQLIESTLEQEELQFLITLEQGLKIFEQEITKLKGKIIPGKTAFKLYDTFGFPLDLTADIAREHELTIDHDEFEAEMSQQRKLSQAASKFKGSVTEKLEVNGSTEFCGYEKLTDSATILNLFQDGMPVKCLNIGEEGIIVLNRTPFYAESGGQIGDSGEIYTSSAKFLVEDTKKQGAVYLHFGKMVQGKLQSADIITAEVSVLQRNAITANHSATHLLQAALRELLGDRYQITQKGSSVDSKRLRFDFAYNDSINHLQLLDIERIVNQKIHANLKVTTNVMTIDDAKKAGALALFDEKYGETVRVVSMGDFSKELCGGTHVKETSAIGLFKIISESGVAAGVRRIEAITSNNALLWFEESEISLLQIEQLLKTSRNLVVDKVKQLLNTNHFLEKEITNLKTNLASLKSKDLTSEAVEINGVKVLAVILENIDTKTLRTTLDELKQKFDSAVIVLATIISGKIQIVVGVTKNIVDKANANELMQHLAKQIDGSGGGRADMAQGGGTNTDNLTNALESVAVWVKSML